MGIRKENKTTNNYKDNLLKAISYVSYELTKRDILIKNIKNKNSYNKFLEINGAFSDDVWVLNNSIDNSYIYYRFDKLRSVKPVNYKDNKRVFKTNSQNIDFINLIKCWVGETVINHYNRYREDTSRVSLKPLRRGFDVFIDFAEKSFFFNKCSLKEVDTFFNSIKSDDTKKRTAVLLIDFLEYGLDKISESNKEIYSQYLGQIKIIDNYLKLKINVRKLSSGKNIYHFANYVDLFFNDKSADEDLKLYYAPVFLWWKITTIIPMRPSEFCTGIKRDCLVLENGNYYLNIKRIKFKPSVNYKRLPTFNKIMINKEIYDIVRSYMNITEKYGESKTLISYRALLAFREKLSQKYKLSYEISSNAVKTDLDAFSSTIFTKLLKSFHNNIIKGYFNDEVMIENIKPGDTRHIAFTSLVLQGYSPVDIAILGGHNTLKTLDSYTSTANIYLDMETLTLSRNAKVAPIIERQKILDIVMSKPIECSKDINNCRTAYINDFPMGYCTGEFNADSYPCEDLECYNCSKWWCFPSKESYIDIENILDNNDDNSSNKIKRSSDFIKILLKLASVELPE